MNIRRLTIQNHLDDTGHTLPAEWNRLELEWSAVLTTGQMFDYVADDYGRWKLGELIDTHHAGKLPPSEMTKLANDLVRENDILLMILDVVGAIDVDPSSLAYDPDSLLRIARHCQKATDLAHAHLLRFVDEAAVFLETRLGNRDLSLAQTRADALARRGFMEMLANVLWAAEAERRAA